MMNFKQLWEELLGTPPPDIQFRLWTELHNEACIRRGILKTAEKNLSLGLAMSTDYKVRFASKVMWTSTRQKQAGQGAQ